MKLSVPGYWRERTPVSWLLYPVSLLFRLLVKLRRQAYQCGLLRTWRSPVPVIVVGNITVGGAGKTPLVIALCGLLSMRKLRVGIVTRGFAGRATQQPVMVKAESDPALAGDEAVLLAIRCMADVVACKSRVLAVRHLLSLGGYDVILSDDGLQHYALDRDFEIAVVDAGFGFGNEFCLPAGPLREPVARLSTVDIVVYSGTDRQQPGYFLSGEKLINVADPAKTMSLASLRGEHVHAVAGIAAPDRFFRSLRAQGLQVKEHPFPDHAAFSRSDFEFDDDLPVILTEKDMVKCTGYGLLNCWYLPVDVVFDDAMQDELNSLMNKLIAS